MTATPRIPGRMAGPGEGRCPGCNAYRCDCPVGVVDRLGYLICTACVEVEPSKHQPVHPIGVHGLSSEDRCDRCDDKVIR